MAKAKKHEIPAFVTKEQFKWESFRTGAPGGQHTSPDSSVKVTHMPSGAVGSSRIHRSYMQNREQALFALSETQEFKDWSAAQEAKLKKESDERKS